MKFVWCLSTAISLLACGGCSAGGVDYNPAAGDVDPESGRSGDGGVDGVGRGGRICSVLAIEADADIDGFRSDVFRWQDSDCRWRSAALVRNDGDDPAGRKGGYMRRYSYQVGGQERICTGSSKRHPGFGYTVNHWRNGVSSSRRTAGAFQTLFTGPHHAIHEYTWTHGIQGKPVAITVHWLFASGRDHPLWAVTFDTSALGQNAVRADSRAPYGDLGYDGDADSFVAGVGWGDHYKFETTSSPLKFDSAWAYNQENTIPYVFSFTSTVDAEMGLVQTQPYTQHDGGGYWFFGSWGKTSSTVGAQDSAMPEPSNWTYQINQFELNYRESEPTRSKRLAWGTNYGAVGQVGYNAYGSEAEALSGYPYQSYATFVVLGEHSSGPTARQVGQMEAVQGVTLTVAEGSLVTAGSVGVGDPRELEYQLAGYDPRYALFRVRAAAGRARVDISFALGGLGATMLVIEDVDSTAVARVDGSEQVYQSYWAARRQLWVTVRGDLFSAGFSLTVE